MCSRSRRPRLDTALSLLLALQKLPVRVDCGEALQLLAERAMAWQDAVKTFLANDEMRGVLTKLGEKTSDHSATAAAAASSAHERADRIVSAEMHRVGLMYRRSSSGSTASQYDERKGAYEPDASAGSMMPIEHAYSSVSKHGCYLVHAFYFYLYPERFQLVRLLLQ
jgi:hypothetical protein